MQTTNDSALIRGIRTTLQALLAFMVGLVLAVWQVPGVPEAVHTYISNNLPNTLLAFGLPLALGTGLVSFLWNVLRPSVKNI
jgi:hypothetical protein